MIKIISFVGYSNGGKTTLIEKLVSEIVAQNLRVSVLKHTSHQILPVKNVGLGKDTDKYLQAGAQHSLLATEQGTIFYTQNDPDPLFFAKMLNNSVDLILVEGYKSIAEIPKIEVNVFGKNKYLIEENQINNIVGIVSDKTKILTQKIPCFSSVEISEIVAFLQEKALVIDC